MTYFLSRERNHFWDAGFCFVSASQLKGLACGLKEAPKGAGRRDPSPLQQAGGAAQHEAGGCCRQPLSKSSFPSPCCYERAPSGRKQSSKAGSCLPGQRGGLSIRPFYFCSVLPNHFKFSLFKMWDIIVHAEIQCGFLSPKALLLGRSPSHLWPIQALESTSPFPSPPII